MSVIWSSIGRWVSTQKIKIRESKSRLLLLIRAAVHLVLLILWVVVDIALAGQRGMGAERAEAVDKVEQHAGAMARCVKWVFVRR